MKRLTIFSKLKNIGKRLFYLNFFKSRRINARTAQNRADYCNAKRLMTQEPPANFWSCFLKKTTPCKIT